MDVNHVLVKMYAFNVNQDILHIKIGVGNVILNVINA